MRRQPSGINPKTRGGRNGGADTSNSGEDLSAAKRRKNPKNSSAVQINQSHPFFAPVFRLFAASGDRDASARWNWRWRGGHSSD
jgi:hypothetical protein